MWNLPVYDYALPTPNDDLLLTSSKSERGWSFYSSAVRCPRLAAFEYSAPITQTMGNRGTDYGTLGHLAQAHYWLHRALRNRDRAVLINNHELISDPTGYASPVQAIVNYGTACGAPVDTMRIMINTHNAWVENRDNPSRTSEGVHLVANRTIGIELEMRLDLGYYKGELNLWLIYRPWFYHIHANGINEDEFTPYLDADGEPIYITRRLDLLQQKQNGQILNIDHKFAHPSYMSKDEGFTNYANDGGFGAFHRIGCLAWGDRWQEDSLLIQRISRQQEKVVKGESKPTAFKVYVFPVEYGAGLAHRDLYQMVMEAHRVKKEARTKNPYDFLSRGNETGACRSHFGEGERAMCTYFRDCRM